MFSARNKAHNNRLKFWISPSGNSHIINMVTRTSNHKLNHLKTFNWTSLTLFKFFQEKMDSNHQYYLMYGVANEHAKEFSPNMSKAQ